MVPLWRDLAKRNAKNEKDEIVAIWAAARPHAKGGHSRSLTPGGAGHGMLR